MNKLKWKHTVGKNTYNDRAKRPPAFFEKLILVNVYDLVVFTRIEGIS